MEFYKDGNLVTKGFNIDDINYPKPTIVTTDYYRDLGVLPVKEVPTINHSKQKIVLVGTPYEEDGFWVVREAADKTIDEKMIEIRSTRNQLLTDTDWTGLSDVTMSADMITYRQALRDLPASVDVDSPVYPTKP
jgi:hypothetical protein